jgi:hypothetical protein
MSTTYETRYEQAIDGLTIRSRGGVVSVDDGYDVWLCSQEAYDRAQGCLEALAPVRGEGGHVAAYDALCSAVSGDIASLVGGSRGDADRLVRTAVDAGLIDSVRAEAYGVTL